MPRAGRARRRGRVVRNDRWSATFPARSYAPTETPRPTAVNRRPSMTSRRRTDWIHCDEPPLCPRPRRPGAFGGGHAGRFTLFTTEHDLGPRCRDDAPAHHRAPSGGDCRPPRPRQNGHRGGIAASPGISWRPGSRGEAVRSLACAARRGAPALAGLSAAADAGSANARGARGGRMGLPCPRIACASGRARAVATPCDIGSAVSRRRAAAARGARRTRAARSRW